MLWSISTYCIKHHILVFFFIMSLVISFGHIFEVCKTFRKRSHLCSSVLKFKDNSCVEHEWAVKEEGEALHIPEYLT